MSDIAARGHNEDCLVGDRELIEFLRRHGTATIQDLVDFAGVTATAVRMRLVRLMQLGLVDRETERAGRGRPSHRYSLSPLGHRSGGNNYEDLATVLWSEIRSVKDPAVRVGLLKRIVGRMAELYGERIEGSTLQERMQSLVELMNQREIPFEVVPTEEGQLPVLKALSCPFPGLAEQDRSICSLEKMLFAEILGDGLKLTDCRLDSKNHYCTFEMQEQVPAVV